MDFVITLFFGALGVLIWAITETWEWLVSVPLGFWALLLIWFYLSEIWRKLEQIRIELVVANRLNQNEEDW